MSELVSSRINLPIFADVYIRYGELVSTYKAKLNSELRESLGKLVREVWIEWAKEQPNPKESWLISWEELDEPDKEVDRRIGEKLAIECKKLNIS